MSSWFSVTMSFGSARAKYPVVFAHPRDRTSKRSCGEELIEKLRGVEIPEENVFNLS